MRYPVECALTQPHILGVSCICFSKSFSAIEELLLFHSIYGVRSSFTSFSKTGRQKGDEERNEDVG